jgi:hypothetical protein
MMASIWYLSSTRAAFWGGPQDVYSVSIGGCAIKWVDSPSGLTLAGLTDPFPGFHTEGGEGDPPKYYHK